MEEVDGLPTYPDGLQEARITANELWNLHVHMGNPIRAWLWRKRCDYLDKRIAMH